MPLRRQILGKLIAYSRKNQVEFSCRCSLLPTSKHERLNAVLFVFTAFRTTGTISRTSSRRYCVRTEHTRQRLGLVVRNVFDTFFSVGE